MGYAQGPANACVYAAARKSLSSRPDGDSKAVARAASQAAPRGTHPDADQRIDAADSYAVKKAV
jgi:hypothetical protein